MIILQSNSHLFIRQFFNYMENEINYASATVKIYHGYGHRDNLVVYGHVLANKIEKRSENSNMLSNVIHLIKLFFIKPIANGKVRLLWGEQQFEAVTAQDGFFNFEWKSNNFVPAGWHTVHIQLLDVSGIVAVVGEGKIFVPHSTQYGFISDIDDTVLVSHSATTGKKLRVMFTKNPRTRKTFSDVVKFYNLLSSAHTEPKLPNPFFYVSSSEWNLYDDLNDFFKYNGLPKGVFLLNAIKKWYQLLKTGNTKDQGKLNRIVRILDVFPNQRFILLGDNSQKDPVIYIDLANRFPEKIVAIYLRNISPNTESITKELLLAIQNKEIATCLFKHTDEAIEHAKLIGLIM